MSLIEFWHNCIVSLCDERVVRERLKRYHSPSAQGDTSCDYFHC